MPDQLVVVGRVGRPHGIGGEMRGIPTGATLATLRVGDRVVLAGAAADPPRELAIVSIRPVDRGVLIRFDGIDVREAAAALTGATISVRDDRLAPIAEPDEFYVRDLVGCDVFTGDVRLGCVVDVHPGAANDALVVRDADGREVLVPFTRDAVTALDVEGRRIAIRDDLLGGRE